MLLKKKKIFYISILTLSFILAVFANSCRGSVDWFGGLTKIEQDISVEYKFYLNNSSTTYYTRSFLIGQTYNSGDLPKQDDDICGKLKPGYKPNGWILKEPPDVTDISKGIFDLDPSSTVKSFTVGTEPQSFYANQWTGGTTTYTVRHLWQNIDDNEYTLHESETVSGIAGTYTDGLGCLKTYTGFETGTYTDVTIEGDKSTVLEIRYNREIITILFEYNDGTSTSGISSSYTFSRKFGSKLLSSEIPILTKSGFGFKGWLCEADGKLYSTSDLDNYAFPATNLTFTAQWIELSTGSSDLPDISDMIPATALISDSGIYKNQDSKTITFTAATASPAYKKYYWSIDAGKFNSTDTNVFTDNYSTFSIGYHSLVVLAQDEDDKIYYTVIDFQITSEDK